MIRMNILPLNKILKGDCVAVLKSLPSNSIDMIFADPPYSMEAGFEIPQLIFENNLLVPGGILVYEHQKNVLPKDHPNFVETRNYGNLSFSFYEMPS